LRRHSDEGAAAAELIEIQTDIEPYNHTDLHHRQQKINKGLSHGTVRNTSESARAIHEGKWKNTNDQPTTKHAAPAWEKHEKIPEMPTCMQDVTQDNGESDYGRVTHQCESCKQHAGQCRQSTAQKPSSLEWQFDPPLDQHNVFDVSFYANWSDIKQLNTPLVHTQATLDNGVGLLHKFEFSIGAKKEEDGTELSFDGWMGPEVRPPSSGNSAFDGKHVFEVRDTLDFPSTHCDSDNPTGRWLATAGPTKESETFTCERKKLPSTLCHANVIRCEAAIAMDSGSLFHYRIRKVQNDATAADQYVGPEWEVTAIDLTQDSSVVVVGRVILTGEKRSQGIKRLSQSHHHLGCVHCDLFYESTIISGPFISDTTREYNITTADAVPPALTSESCEKFRISSMGGTTVMFETGPGVWAASQARDTIFSACDASPKDANTETVVEGAVEDAVEDAGTGSNGQVQTQP